MKKYVYAFKEGRKEMKDILGGKGANLCEMTYLKLPVPNGFIVTTEACNDYYENNEILNETVIDQIFFKLNELENSTGKKYGSKDNPLLLSVRSGSRASMPGMMDTILNLGLNDEVIAGMIENTKNERFVYDLYRRFISMYADVVMEFPRDSFDQIFNNFKKQKKVKNDQDLNAEDLLKIIENYKENYRSFANQDFPNDPRHQLIECVKAVFRSWNNPRAIIYRKMNDIPSSWGTAVNIQEMVYGNNGNNSGTGVAFSRNPATGEDVLYGEYLINAQGEDVVAGIRTPEPISKLKEIMPEIYDEFYRYAKILERHYRDMQDMEFTIDNGKLYMLQTRNGKRTIKAALKIATDMVKEGLITKEMALLSVNPNQITDLLHPTFDEKSLEKGEILTTGLPASPGAATGKIYFNANDVVIASNQGESVILVRPETSPEDIEGMKHAVGILTFHGGMTSHAAVVARGMGRCCITGCDTLSINEKDKTLIIKKGVVLKEGDYISLDGSTGKVYKGQIKTKPPVMNEDFKVVMDWSNEIRNLKIRANADTKHDALQALEYGAEGIGLCRTEHMFFKENRIFEIRKMIIANDEKIRTEALEKLLIMQREDFIELFEVMNGLPVTIRYLDPPLHEFLPVETKDIQKLAQNIKMKVSDLRAHINLLKEVNPMMGHRGGRLAVTYPEIINMQTRAIIEAAIISRKKGIEVLLELMIPLISDVKELKYLIDLIKKEATKVLTENDIDVQYSIGTMIEVPRAALIADRIAENVDFFSYGTNDLTQMTYGFSRDDASKFLNDYYEKQIFDYDPFERIDVTGVGELVEIATKRGREVKPDLKLGICGEHGGEPSSIEFCNNIGLDYVSCSPYRIPIAILAAAQAKIKLNLQYNANNIEIISFNEDEEVIDNNINNCLKLIEKHGFKIELIKINREDFYEFEFKIRK